MTDQHRRSLEDKEGFWGEIARHMDWFQPWDRVLEHEGVGARWFVGATCNVCYNALDRHVLAGHGARTAIIWDSPMAGVVQRYGYGEVLESVRHIAGALQGLGVTKGDRVLISMPMIPEALMAALACARIGAVHAIVFGGFAGPELSRRILAAEPKVILAASCGLEPGRVVPYGPMIEEALALAPGIVQRCVFLQRDAQHHELKAGRDLDWHAWLEGASPCDAVPVQATDPLYILYTSGTTGQPKGVVRDHGGYMVALHWSMEAIYAIEPGEVFWSASDIGWVVGHSYIIYGPLLKGATTVVYEGKPVGTPDAGAFWRVMEAHHVKALFTAPTAFRAIKKEDPQGLLIANYNLNNFTALFLAGERCDPDTLRWAEAQLKVPVIDHWWQTETGWAIAAPCVGEGNTLVKPGSAGPAAPGYDLVVLDEDHNPLPPGEMGALCVRLPLPPGCFPTLWQAHQRFLDAYFSTHPGYYDTSDAGYIDADGYAFVMSRTDDIINVAGHRLSTGALEEVLTTHPDVAECAVIGVNDALKGEIPVGLVVLNAGATIDPEALAQALVAQVRTTIGPVAALKTILVVNRLPKTRSGKILRAVMRKIANQEPWSAPPTIDDPAILDEIGSALQRSL